MLYLLTLLKDGKDIFNSLPLQEQTLDYKSLFCYVLILLMYGIHRKFDMKFFIKAEFFNIFIIGASISKYERAMFMIMLIYCTLTLLFIMYQGAIKGFFAHWLLCCAIYFYVKPLPLEQTYLLYILGFLLTKFALDRKKYAKLHESYLTPYDLD